VFHGGSLAAAATILALVAAIVVVFANEANASLRRSGLGFLTGVSWDPDHNIYGALPAVVGTLLTSGLALLFAVPLALAVAVFLGEMAPSRLRGPLTYAIDLGAAVPSVIYGFWAYKVLVPIMRSNVEPALAHLTGGRFLFSGFIFGQDSLTAGLVLAVMILPTIAAISRESLRAVPRIHRESALGLGATRWEATRIAVLGPARTGILGGVMLGLGRALGETIAVTMVIGNRYALPTSLFSPAQTIASLIVNNFYEAGPLEVSALVEIGLLLLLISLLVNSMARTLVWTLTRSEGTGAEVRPRAIWRRLFRAPSSEPATQARTLAVVPSGPAGPRRERVQARLRQRAPRRRWVQWIALVVTLGCCVLALIPLATIIDTAVVNGGAAVIRPSFYVSELPVGCNPTPGNATTPARVCPIGGIGPAIQGTLILVGLASLIAVPLGLLAGIYLSEYGRGRFSRFVSFITEVMTGIPSILIGLFIYVIVFAGNRNLVNTGWAGALALSLLMIPIITRTTEEGLRLVPIGLREAALGLGFPRHRVTARIVLGSAASAIVTGILLGVARAAGETAALVLTAGSSNYWFQGLNAPVAAMAPYIFTYFQTTYSNWQEDAWGAALVLLGLMLVVSMAARMAFRPRGSGADAGG
jgi:phosphate transport system permease protein